MLRKVCKKSSLGTPSKNISVFAGFTSRWMMALECKYAKPVGKDARPWNGVVSCTSAVQHRTYVRTWQERRAPPANQCSTLQPCRSRRIRKTLCILRLRVKRARGTSGHLNSHLARHPTRDRPLAKAQVPNQGGVGGLHAYDPSCRCECNLHP